MGTKFAWIKKLHMFVGLLTFTAFIVWVAYNEFSNWAFLLMTLSGIYLWLATRPKVVWAWATFVLALVFTRPQGS